MFNKENLSQEPLVTEEVEVQEELSDRHAMARRMSNLYRDIPDWEDEDV